MTDVRGAILGCGQHMLVIGGPGSGKTTVALKKAVKRISEGMALGQKVLFLSFSRAAVARIVQATENEKLGEKSELVIQTFHSFFWEILRTHGYLLGAPRSLGIMLPHDEKARSGGAKPGSPNWSEWLETREKIFREEGRVPFDLLAPKVAEAFARSSVLSRLTAHRYPLIIIDEAQDTGPEAWSCVESLAAHAQILCLADLDQQIFDHLPGIGPERIDRIVSALNPERFDLGGENNRSPGTDICTFANDMLLGQAKASGLYAGASRSVYPMKGRDAAIRSAVGGVYRTIKARTGKYPESMAILAPSAKGVTAISAALSGGKKSIPHKVLFDEVLVLLSARFGAFLLEPEGKRAHLDDVAVGLELVASIRRASGSRTSLSEAEKLNLAAIKMKNGKAPRTKFELAMHNLLLAVRKETFSGDPRRDWIVVKRVLCGSGEKVFSAVASHLDMLIVFRRGHRIECNLSSLWKEHGNYSRARQALDEALMQDQILSDSEDETGIHVMTIHKAKGKQFDTVIVLRESVAAEPRKWRSSFVWRSDLPPYNRSRKILRVAITRARKHVHIVEPVFACPILGSFKERLATLF